MTDDRAVESTMARSRWPAPDPDAGARPADGVLSADRAGVRQPGSAPIDILIVDDEPSNLAVLEAVLDDPSYRLIRAESADQALLALIEHEFALLILDVRMPDLSGFELAKLVKQRKRIASVPIIFLTAYDDTDQIVLEGYGSGAVDFLSKPVNPTVLRSKVAVFAELHTKERALSLANQALRSEVAERKRAEDALRELNETLERRVSERTEALRQADRKLQVMMSSITDGLFMLDRDRRFTYCNEQGARILGLQVERMLGRSLSELFPPERADRFLDGYERAVRTQQTVSFVDQCPAPLNTWLQCHCYPSDEGLAVYFHDVTDRLQMEARREEVLAAEQAARTEGERLARNKDEFLASLSHELRSPLAAIVTWATVLERPNLDPQTVRKGIDAIGRNARAQAKLVDDLLDMNRVISGRLRMDFQTLDLVAVASTAVDATRPAFLAKGISLEVELTASPLPIRGDELRLQQVASNILTNALKFTPAGGSVRVAAAGGLEQVELIVADTGVGIDAAFLPNIFERFSQADGSAAREHGGMGLGLSIVKTLVRMHGGEVTAYSGGRGQGATFTVRLPRWTSRSSTATVRPAIAGTAGADGWPAAPARAGTVASLHGVSVLLVDDHSDLLDVQHRLLSDAGAEVTIAGSAAEGLEYLRARRFDVLLSDLGMPGMDGYELIDHVRTRLGIDATRLPAAAITAFVRPEDQQRALQAGYQACLTKPVAAGDLEYLVYRLARLP
ncbi:MAG: response regulator [Lautropia sp.]